MADFAIENYPSMASYRIVTLDENQEVVTEGQWFPVEETAHITDGVNHYIALSRYHDSGPIPTETVFLLTAVSEKPNHHEE